MTIACGIAGWSYDDWRGIVYPKGCKDMLRFCAELVDVIEINSTFYRVPDARLCASWAERVRDLAIVFTAKLPRELTHERRADDALIASTREGLAPLAESGKLKALLAQFSHAFVAGAESHAWLARLAASLDPVAPLVVEVRHRSWAAPEALASLRALGVSVCNLDYPGATTGFGPRVSGINGRASLAYLRLHGRSRAWFDKGAGRDAVYDWEYSSDEVAELAARAVEIARDAALTIVVANNHFEGKAMKAALELLAFLRGQPVAVPEPLVQRYPGLAAIRRA